MTVASQRIWAALAAVTLLNLPLGALYAFSVFLKSFEQLVGLTRAEMSLVFGVATVMFTIGANVAPYIYRLAPAPVLVAGCTISTALGIALSGMAGGLPELVAGFGVLFGLGGGIGYMILQQGANLLVEKRRGLLNGYIVGLYPLGAMIAAPLCGWGIQEIGPRATLGWLAVAMAVSGFASAGLARVAGITLAAATHIVPSEPETRRPVVFWLLWMAFFLAAAAGLTVLSQAAGIVAAYGGSTALALFGTTYITGCIAFARLTGGWLVDRFAIPTVMAGAHICALAGGIVLTLFPGPLVAMFTLAMVGMGYGFISGSTAAAVACYWSVGSYGRVAGRLYIAWCVAAITLPILAGFLYDLTGGYETTVIIAGCGNLFGILVALCLPRQARPQAALPPAAAEARLEPAKR